MVFGSFCFVSVERVFFLLFDYFSQCLDILAIGYETVAYRSSPCSPSKRKQHLTRMQGILKNKLSHVIGRSLDVDDYFLLTCPPFLGMFGLIPLPLLLPPAASRRGTVAAGL